MSLRKRHPCTAAARAQQTHGPGTQACAPECAEAASLSTRAGRAFHADTVACTIQSVKLTGRTRLPDMIAARSLRGRGAQEAKCRSENVTLAMRPRALSKFPRSRHTSMRARMCRGSIAEHSPERVRYIPQLPVLRPSDVSRTITYHQPSSGPGFSKKPSFGPISVWRPPLGFSLNLGKVSPRSSHWGKSPSRTLQPSAALQQPQQPQRVQQHCQL